MGRRLCSGSKSSEMPATLAKDGVDQKDVIVPDGMDAGTESEVEEGRLEEGCHVSNSSDVKDSEVSCLLMSGANAVMDRLKSVKNGVAWEGQVGCDQFTRVTGEERRALAAAVKLESDAVRPALSVPLTVEAMALLREQLPAPACDTLSEVSEVSEVSEASYWSERWLPDRMLEGEADEFAEPSAIASAFSAELGAQGKTQPGRSRPSAKQRRKQQRQVEQAQVQQWLPAAFLRLQVEHAALNGEYRQNGKCNGKPWYTKVGDESCVIRYYTYNGGPHWVLRTKGIGDHFSATTDASTTGPPESGWGSRFPDGSSVSNPGSGSPRVIRAGAPALMGHLTVRGIAEPAELNGEQVEQVQAQQRQTATPLQQHMEQAQAQHWPQAALLHSNKASRPSARQRRKYRWQVEQAGGAGAGAWW